MRPGATRWTVWAAVAATCMALIGCGDDEPASPSGPDPATVAPADALLYAEAVLRPEGEQRDDVEAALGTLLGTEDPGATIAEQLEIAFGDEAVEFSYAEDIEPWLGQRAGVFFLNLEAEADGAFVIETTDEEEARAALERLIEREGRPRDASYEGVDYVHTDADDAAGIVDGFAVLGSKAGFEATVDASQDGSLAESTPFVDATEDLEGDGLVTAYTDPQLILDTLVEAGALTDLERNAVALALGDVGEAPVVATAGADDSAIYAELSTASDTPPLGGGTDLLERAPDDAWVAFGLADAGPLLGPALTGALASDQVLSGVLERLQDAGGIDLVGFGESVGDAAGWFGGSNVLAATGALIFEATDEDAANELLGGLREAFSADPAVTVSGGELEGEAFSVGPAEVPLEFPFVLRDGLLVTGLGEQSVEQAYDPESSLADSEPYEAAQEALGDGFSTSLFLDFQTLVEFFSLLNTADEPDLQAVLPYLSRLDVFAAGAREEDGTATVRFILRPGEGE